MNVFKERKSLLETISFVVDFDLCECFDKASKGNTYVPDLFRLLYRCNEVSSCALRNTGTSKPFFIGRDYNCYTEQFNPIYPVRICL